MGNRIIKGSWECEAKMSKADFAICNVRRNRRSVITCSCLSEHGRRPYGSYRTIGWSIDYKDAQSHYESDGLGIRSTSPADKSGEVTLQISSIVPLVTQ